MWKEVKERLEENNQQIRAGNAVSSQVSQMLRLHWFKKLDSDLKNFMRKIYAIT